MALLRDGVMDDSELAAQPGVPSVDRLRAGPVAVVECSQEIPCNPCAEACRHGAIQIGEPITERPVLNDTACTGCALCIAACPGQAIFVVDATFSPGQGTVQMPYEFLPLPLPGMTIDGLDRSGTRICQGRVVKVQSPRSFDRTAVITVAVPVAFVMNVRNLSFERE